MFRKSQSSGNVLREPLAEVQGRRIIFNYTANEAEVELSTIFNLHTKKWLIRKSSVTGLLTVTCWRIVSPEKELYGGYRITHNRIVVKHDKTWTLAPADKAAAEEIALQSAHALHMLETDQDCGNNLLTFLELNFAISGRSMDDLLLPESPQAAKEYGYIIKPKK